MVAHTGEEHLHLFPRRVLGFVEDDERFFQGPAAHVGQWRHFDDVAVDHLLELVIAEHVGQGVVERAQVRVDLFLQVTGQEAQFFPGFDSRPGQDDPFDFAVLEIKSRQGYGQVGLARPGRTDAEGDQVLADGIDVAFLAQRLGLDETAPGRNADRIFIEVVQGLRLAFFDESGRIADVLRRQIGIFPEQVAQDAEDFGHIGHILFAADDHGRIAADGNAAVREFALHRLEEFVFHAQDGPGFTQIGKLQFLFYQSEILLYFMNLRTALPCR